MSKEEKLSKSKVSKKITVIILIIALIIGCISGIKLYRENKLRCAFRDFDRLLFDNMTFECIDDCKDSKELNRTDNIICKTTKGDWIIWSVEGYEESFEYVYANCFMDGYYYKKISE